MTDDADWNEESAFAEAVYPDVPYAPRPSDHTWISRFRETIGHQFLAYYDPIGDIKDQKLAVGFVESEDFNAFCIVDDKTDVIAINGCVYRMLLAAARMILSHPEVLPDRGSLGGIREAYTRAKDAAGDPWHSSFWSIPPLQDLERDGLAGEIAFGGLLFIYFHEAFHLVNGHTSWVSRQLGLNRLQEIKLPDGPEFEGCIRQTLEWDADIGAVQSLLLLALEARVSRNNGSQVWEVDSQILQPRVELAAMSIHIVQLFYNDDSELNLDKLIRFEHPPAAIRQYFCMNQIAHVLEKRCQIAPDTSLDYAMPAAYAVDFGWSRALGKQVNTFFNNDTIAIAAALVERYEKEWAGLYHELLPLKRGGRLAPPNPNDPH